MNVILFDGVCNLCNSTVYFIIRRDPKGKFKFASIQSEVGQSLFKRLEIQSGKIDSIIYLKDDKYFIKSTAVLKIFRDLGGFWKAIYSFIIIPKFVRDFVYDLIAKSRYKVFGKSESCMVPTEYLKSRFID
ncbi:MAG: thiol-disulfide oxidoreductase DCC family protein [Tenuifilaceae bacterium]